jgi:enamine deaminase RidA (YjgF/YER057c/UK114 family)
MSAMHYVDVPGYPAPHSPYAHAVIANGFVFVSGQIPVRPGGGPTEIAGTTMQEQARQALTNVKTILEAAGSSLDRLVKVTVAARATRPLPGDERGLRGILSGRQASAGDGALRRRYPRRARRHRCDRAGVLGLGRQPRALRGDTTAFCCLRNISPD